MNRAPIPLPRDDTVPVYRDVYQRLRTEILSGRLPAGARLPSSRILAKQLGIARGTVEVAFQMLAGEGYTIADGARGTIVNPALPRSRKAASPRKPPSPSPAQHLRFPPGAMLFQMGLPAIDAFPRKQWSQIAARVVRRLDIEQLAHPHDILGYAPLRQAIASYLKIARDISCTAEQVMITAGFQGALSLIVQALLAPGDQVWVEDPGYFFARDLLREARLRLAPIPVDAEGLDVAAGTRMAPNAELAVVTPTHQFPLGMTLPVDRRLALLDWAERERTFIVEDDYDCEFHHRGLPPPALKSLDRSGRVFYVGSFSKVLFPGLRLGYVVLPDAMIERFVRLARPAPQGPAIMVQQQVEAFMSAGHFARHLSRMRGLYTERRKALAAALTATMPRQLDIRLEDGGMHFVARLRGRASDVGLVDRLRRQGIHPAPLSRCSYRSNPPRGLLIGYPNVARDDAAAAAQRMLAAMR
jgi:GntR family transcriptional regulator/MocR family aminotransferase